MRTLAGSREGWFAVLLVSRKATPLYLVYAASALNGVVYRAVSGCPPTLDDFRSYVELGTLHTTRQRFRASGVSVFRDRAVLRGRMRRFGLGPAIATLDLRQTDAVWAESGGRGHVTVWAPADVLHSGMVQCDDHG